VAAMSELLLGSDPS